MRRRFEFELEQLRRRIHLLEGFRIIFNALDKAIKIIRESDGKADASEKLRKAFGLDEEQATAVLDAQLYKIAQMEIKKILDELKEKQAEAEKIETILEPVDQTTPAAHRAKLAAQIEFWRPIIEQAGVQAE